MGILRSEVMKQGTLVLPHEGAREYIDIIGKKLNMQFEDMNTREMRRPYRKFIQRIEEMERIIRLLTVELPTFHNCDITKNRIEEFMSNDSVYKLEAVEGELLKINKHYVEWKGNNAKLLVEKNAAIEELAVINRALELIKPTATSFSEPLLGGQAHFSEDRRSTFNSIAGVVNQSDAQRLRLAVFRAAYGNAFMDLYEIEEPMQDPKTGSICHKSVAVIFFQGSQELQLGKGSLHEKVKKICQAFGVNLYEWPNEREAQAKQIQLVGEYKGKEKLLAGSMMVMQTEMEELVRAKDGLNSKIEEYRMFCTKEKAIYSILNMCTGDAALRVNIWFPAADEHGIQQLLKKNGCGKGFIQKIKAGAASTTPPTYTRVNDFTEGWQDVINTYGVPRYQEANPALFSLVTFPFIFGMMYGDVGHGSMLLMAGILLCVNADKIRYTQPTMYYARFIILQLGMFATFAGFMYNDFFSVSLRLFPSRYEDPDKTGVWTPTWDIKNEGGAGPYPFGLDWMWNGAGNELLFVNSMKMKLSVLFGVIQMTLGVFIRWSNAFHAHNMVDLFCECIPMLVFMLCFFGWMDYMVLYKWTHVGPTGPPNGPPSIINSLICMAMGQEDLYPIYPGSVELSQTLMKFTMAAVPILLLPKPFILKARYDEAQEKKAALAEEGGEFELFQDEEAPTGGTGGGGHGDHGGHGEDFDMSEIVIHQVIETIEYVLGTVSHTASYLRIWALSLAHQQLSVVFFQKTLQMGLEMPFPMCGPVLFFMFTAWFGVTCAVLLGMDVMECFLHTLRLHWVEFQSKFYNIGGAGYAFEPFNIKKIVTPADDA